MSLPLHRRDVMRRVVQLFVVALIVAVPAVSRYRNYLSARELDRTIEKWQGTMPGVALTAIDTALRLLPGAEAERAGRMQRERSRLLAYTQEVRGGPWSAEIGGLSITDPLAIAEAVAARRTLPWVLAAGVIVPVAATLLLGRVFCSWICPMGLLLECSDKLRGVLRLLELRPRDVRISRGVKYGILCLGMVLAVLLSAPVLGYVYPPAMVARELHRVVLTWFDRAEMGRYGLSLDGLSWITVALLGIALVEIAVSRRWWCRYACPGGALYSLLGAARLVRVTLSDERCTGCGRCVAACPMGLDPMRNEMGIECDNCGECISSCAERALTYAVAGPAARMIHAFPAASADTPCSPGPSHSGLLDNAPDDDGVGRRAAPVTPARGARARWEARASTPRAATR